MLALIAGTGDLPPAILAQCDEPVLCCAMAGFAPSVPVDLPFRIEHLGSFLAELRARGVTEVCMAGAIRRPQIDPSAIDHATMPLVPQIQQAIASGDDGALRVVIAIFEDRGLTIRAAHEIAPKLLPPSGVLTDAPLPATIDADVAAGDATLTEMGRIDSGQACVIRDGVAVLQEGQDGTDAMLRSAMGEATGGLLFKGPKPMQDRRADLPVIGPATADALIAAELAGIVIVAGGVMVLDLAQVLDRLNAAGKFLWVRESPVT